MYDYGRFGSAFTNKGAPKMTMALVLRIKQNIQSATSYVSTGKNIASFSSESIAGPVSEIGTRATDMISSGSIQIENSRSPTENLLDIPDHKNDADSKSFQPESKKISAHTLKTSKGNGNMEGSPSLTNVNLGTEIPSSNLKIAEDMVLDASLKLFQNVKEEVSTTHLDESTQPDGDHVMDVRPLTDEPIIDPSYEVGIDESQVSILDLPAVPEGNVADFNFRKRKNTIEPTVIFLGIFELTPWLQKFDHLQFTANMEGVSSIWCDHGIFLLEGSNLYYMWLYIQLSHHNNVLEKLMIITWDPGSSSWVSKAESSSPWNSKGAVASVGALQCPTTSEVPDYQKTRRYQSVSKVQELNIQCVCQFMCSYEQYNNSQCKNRPSINGTISSVAKGCIKLQFSFYPPSLSESQSSISPSVSTISSSSVAGAPIYNILKGYMVV